MQPLLPSKQNRVKWMSPACIGAEGEAVGGERLWVREAVGERAVVCGRERPCAACQHRVAAATGVFRGNEEKWVDDPETA